MGPGPRPEWSGIARGASHPHANPARDRMHTLDRQADQLRARRHRGGAAARSCLGGGRSRALRAARAVPVAGAGRCAAPAGEALAGRALRRARRLRAAAAGVAPVVIGGAAERAARRRHRRGLPAARDLTGGTSFADLVALGAAGALCGRQRHRPHAPHRRRRRAGDGALFRPPPIPRSPRRGDRASAVLRRADLADLGVEEVAATLAFG